MEWPKIDGFANFRHPNGVTWQFSFAIPHTARILPFAREPKFT